MSTIIVGGAPERHDPGCLASALWFVFVGWWLSALAVCAAWVLMLTIVGIPAAVAIINQLPKLVALREPGRRGSQMVVVTNPTVITPHATIVGNTTVMGAGAVGQHNLLLRAIYLLLVGWWFSALWMMLAWAICCTIIGMPLGFWMFDRTPAILSLHRD